jgi:uncharacterized membrane protein YoaK (UPF0700 family)
MAAPNPQRGTPDDPHYALGFAVLLAALAGWVDAVGFVQWNGLYVSFMSGNSTALGAASATADVPQILQVGGVILAFVAGVVCGELFARAAAPRGRPLVLLLEALLLALAAVAILKVPAREPAAFLLAFAMGLQNASVHQAGGISVSLTYVTGTLVQMSRRIAAALWGHGPWSAAVPFLVLWLGLVSGAAAGALVVGRSAPAALGLAALFALGLSGIIFTFGPRPTAAGAA